MARINGVPFRGDRNHPGHGRPRREAPGRGRGGHSLKPSRDSSPPPGLYLELRRLLRRNVNLHASPVSDKLEVWTTALSVLNGDENNFHQNVARDLASDELNGHSIILKTVNLCTTSSANPEILRLANQFLQVLTYPALLDSISIDSYLGEIYRSYGGTNGDRALGMLTSLCGRLWTNGARDSASPGTVSTTNSSDVAIFSAMLQSLYQLLSRELRVRFNEDITAVLETANTLIDNIAPDRVSEMTRQSWRQQVITMRRLVEIATGCLIVSIPDDLGDHNSPHSSRLRSSFPLPIAPPGGRHNNDHAKITEIQILPTLDEILSDQDEYLPSTDFSQSHHLHDPVQRHIDSMFRLLRHDVFGTVKDVLSELLSQVDGKRTPQIHNNDARANLYAQASLRHVFIDDRRGLEATLCFLAPNQVRAKTKADQRRWWQETSRLEEGSLVCLLSGTDQAKSILFLEVVTKKADGNRDHRQNKGDSRQQQHNNTSCLVPESGLPTITVRLGTRLPGDLELLMQSFGQQTSKAGGTLVEFHSLIPATFTPVLQNLQRMMGEGHLKFQEWLLPENDGSPIDATNIPPPAYAHEHGFTFCLESIVEGRSDRQGIQPLGFIPAGVGPSETDWAGEARIVEEHTTLDHGQCIGLLAALRREYALIQGPPGTGKSYVGVQLVRVLLGNKTKAKMGPILVICYTNHALDQFLHHLLEVGIEKIIRIGGRSTEPKLEGRNLRVVSKEVPRSRVKSHILGKTYSDLETYAKSAGNALKPFHQGRKGASWALLERHIRTKSPSIHRQLDPGTKEADSDGWQSVRRDDPLLSWLGRRPQTANNDLSRPNNHQPTAATVRILQKRAEQNIQGLKLVERWDLVDHWFEELRNEQTGRLYESLEAGRKSQDNINAVHSDVDRRALVQADVIGITTTALAKNIALLRRVKSKVVICEEAGEVLEPHVLSALMPGVEHLIQIGDHRQLRPQINNYSLSTESSSATKFQLDRSQFERRAKGEPGLGKAPVAQLNIQRRMRPEISNLIRNIYPHLQDHINVQNYPDVVGMRQNIFWLDHENMEDSSSDDVRVRSHSNDWEVDMAAGLVRHLVRQGEYDSTDIALLTPYTGQLRKLRRKLGQDFEIFLSDRDKETLAAEGQVEDEETSGPKSLVKKTLAQTLRLATVDNFQGEEAKIVIVSLVRSNHSGKVGFLRTENRINVLLSRAQHGLYLIGNSATYNRVPMWLRAHDLLAHSNSVGPGIPLCCPRHPQTDILCLEPDDFIRKSPEGGCQLLCERRLTTCGHRCPVTCHSNMMHSVVSCVQPCQRLRETCAHGCPKLCGQACGRCMIKIDNIVLPCGHSKHEIACHELLAPEKIPCTVDVPRTVPGCGHVIMLECSKKIDSEGFRCPKACHELLQCGHPCKGTCGTCRKTGNVMEHPRCTKICNRPFSTCSHRCSKPCHVGQSCGTCSESCMVRCPHSSCGSLCNEACAPCIESCLWACEHRGSCPMPCAAPCTRLPCDKRCSKRLSCDHQCPSYCGEDCPEGFCQECCGEDRRTQRVDMLEFKEYSDINLGKTPIVVLGCGHFFAGETLDGLVDLSQVYMTNKITGQVVELRDLSGTTSSSAIPACPDCKRPIRQFATRRYNRVINWAVIEETTKRFISKGKEDLEKLEARLVAIEETLSSTLKSTHTLDDDWKRYSKIKELEQDASTLRSVMDRKHQPIKKLRDAIVTRGRQLRNSLDERISNLELEDGDVVLPEFDNRVMLGATLVCIKAREVVLRDKFSMGKSTSTVVSTAKKIQRQGREFLKDCEDLITEARRGFLIRIEVSAILALAKISELAAWYSRTQPGLVSTTEQSDTYDREKVKDMLETALTACDKLPEAQGNDLRHAVEATLNLYDGRPRYEPVSPEEMAAIKTAMISGAGGIATHAGHWYNCVNGHPFAIGECGMPMEQARCPECGAPIGGQSHTLIHGNTRATAMEN